MIQDKKQIHLIISLNHELTHKVANSVINSYNAPKFDMPQADLAKEIGLDMSHFGVILTRMLYDGSVKKNFFRENKPPQFETFLKNICDKNQNEKLFFLRSCFLEKNKKNDLIVIKNVLNEQLGYEIKFTIILDDLINLLNTRFLSKMYQIPSNFRFSQIQSFYKHMFSNEIKKSIQCMANIIDIFGEENTKFIYLDQVAKTENATANALKQIGLSESKILERNVPEINPIFIKYLNCCALENELNIHGEIRQLQEIYKKYNLENKTQLKYLSLDIVIEIENFYQEIELISKVKNIQKISIIKDNQCSLKTFTKYKIGKSNCIKSDLL